MSLCFFAEKVILELKCTKSTSLELLRTPETDFHELEFFCRQSHLELKCTKNTSLELLRTPILCLVQLAN